MDRLLPASADVLIVGAGLAGAAAARALAVAGRHCIVLDKGRGPGGRLSTRRIDGAGFDHGAACLQAVGEAFRAWLDAEVRAGRMAVWGETWVGVPGMDAVVAGLLDGLDVRWSVTVAGLHRRDGLWTALAADGRCLAEAPALVLAVPAPQALALLSVGLEAVPGMAALTGLGELVEALRRVRFAPCWAGLVVVDEAAAPLASGSQQRADSVLAVIFREADKPGRATAGHWVLHATEAWSQTHLELDAERVAPLLRAAFVDASGVPDTAIRSMTAHRWRYAQPISGMADGAAAVQAGLMLAGDAIGLPADAAVPPAERAWRSGGEAAARLLLAGLQPKS